METITNDGVVYPVLKADKNGIVNCPFCYQKHKHGKGGGNGHRVAHCNMLLIRNPIFTKEGWCKKENGYFVKFQ